VLSGLELQIDTGAFRAGFTGLTGFVGVTGVGAGLAAASAGPKDTRRGATGGGAEARGVGGKAAVACSGLRRSPTAGDEGPRSGLLEAAERKEVAAIVDGIIKIKNRAAIHWKKTDKTRR